MPPPVLQWGFSALQPRLWLELLPPVRAEFGALQAAPEKCSWKNLCVPAVPTWGCRAPLDGGGNVTEALAWCQAVLGLRLRSNRSHALQWTCDLESSCFAQRAAKVQNEDTSLLPLLLTSSQLLYSVNIPIRIGQIWALPLSRCISQTSLVPGTCGCSWDGELVLASGHGWHAQQPPELRNIYFQAAIAACLLAHHALGLGTQWWLQTERCRQIYWGRWKKSILCSSFPCWHPVYWLNPAPWLPLTVCNCASLTKTGTLFIKTQRSTK